MANPPPTFTPAWRQTTTLTQAFAFTINDIKNFADDVANHAGDIWQATGFVGDAIHLARAAQDLFFALDPNTVNKPNSSVLYPRNDLTDKRMLFDWNGIHIRSTTLYDTLAYILSVTGTLPHETADTVRDYYLPLAALYANWCFKIATQFNDQYGTFLYHIAWFDTPARPSRKILLGSTIGSNAELRTDIKDARADILRSIGYREPPASERGAQNFGGCAETGFFQYAMQAQTPANTASGFALDLKDLRTADRLAYNERQIAGCLRNPCQQSCQNLFGQLGWRGNPTFQVQQLKNRLQ